jgi:uncharacterized protein YjbI with pentapeptide repeats
MNQPCDTGYRLETTSGVTMETTKIIQMEVAIIGTYLRIADQIIQDLEITNEVISGCKYENIVFENVSFIDCDFQGTVFLSTKFIDCEFINCNFNFSKLNNCNLIACKIENCKFCITNSLNCNFLSCTYINNDWEASSTNGAFHNCNIEDNEMSNMEITLTHEVPSLSTNMELCVA